MASQEDSGTNRVQRQGCIAYPLQLIFCYPVIALAGLPATWLLSAVGFSGEHGSIEFGGYQAVVYLYVGALVGRVVASWAPSLVRTGRWIGVLPGVVIVPDVVSQILQRQPIPRLPEALFWGPGDEALYAFLFTFPTCAAVGYSLGMLFARRNRGDATPNQRSSPARAAWFGFFSAVLFCGLVFCLHSYEQAKVEKWRRVAWVIDPKGLRFAPNAQLLCAPLEAMPTPHVMLLSSGTHVEKLERRACNRGIVIPLNEMRPPIVGQEGAFLVERVLVLDGGRANSVGWVPVYGLMEH